MTRLGQNEKERLIGLADRLHQRMVGQDQAVSVVAEVVLRSRAGLERPQQTTSSFIFLGSTGVGKTELAKALIEQLFDNANLLTDGQVSMVDFTNIAIIMTSNLGAEYLLKGLMGKCSMDSARELVMQEVRKHFMPELLNRLDEIVVFDPLSHEQLRKVASKVLKSGCGYRNGGSDAVAVAGCKGRSVTVALDDVAVGLAERRIALGVTEEASDVILAESYDPASSWCEAYSKMVGKEGGHRVSKMLITGKIDEKSTVCIDAAYNGMVLTYRVEENGAVVNAATGQKSDILILLPNGPRSDAAQTVKKG
ncbi:hypothetical protein TEA_003518 [Camellia sinensis var. sinensis]|uniref:ATPase AAA-type core domain-containing protein n=1 Tax=Camellia sinensis var. sinensis TaxID=542762 RepID=A0A4S4DT36_CAMSN|nr:hypothetical protein TEA_003518 [Camellia sinensis var. sinensis]